MNFIIGRKGGRASSRPTTAEDTQRVSHLWDEQEQQHLDKLSSDPVLDRIPARKPKGKLSQLLKALDSLEQGGTR
jgi:hypothetical protein